MEWWVQKLAATVTQLKLQTNWWRRLSRKFHIPGGGGGWLWCQTHFTQPANIWRHSTSAPLSANGSAPGRGCQWAVTPRGQLPLSKVGSIGGKHGDVYKESWEEWKWSIPCVTYVRLVDGRAFEPRTLCYAIVYITPDLCFYAVLLHKNKSSHPIHFQEKRKSKQVSHLITHLSVMLHHYQNSFFLLCQSLLIIPVGSSIE